MDRPSVAQTSITRCKWCGRFVTASTPTYRWYRAWGLPGDATHLGWTEPQTLCPECATDAANWYMCHAGVFEAV